MLKSTFGSPEGARISSSQQHREKSASGPSPLELPSEHLPPGRLPQVMRARDFLVLCLIAVLLISNVSLIAGAGGVAFIYWILGFLAFLIPSALVCAQLYRLFPGEGAVYLWANKAFGSFWDTFVGFFCNWLPGMLGMLVAVTSIVTYLQAINANWLVPPWQQGLVQGIGLLLAQGLCFLPQRKLQPIINGVFTAYVCIFVLLGLAGVIWLLTGHHPQGDFSAAAWSIGPTNWPVFGVTIVCLLGMAVPLNLGAEAVSERSVRGYLLWGVVICVVGYLIATFAIMVILPSGDAVNPALIAEAFSLTFGPGFGGVLQGIVNLILVMYFVIVAATFNLMFARLLMLGGVDRRMPAILQRLNRNQIPANAMVTQTAINIALVIIIYGIAPLFAPSNQAFSQIVFLVAINGAAVIWYIAMIGLFLCALLLFTRYRHRLARNWIVPPFLLYIAAFLGILSSCLAIYSTLFAGSPLPQLLSNADWAYWVFVVTLASLAVGAAYSFLVPEAEDLVALITPQQTANSSEQAVRPGGVEAVADDRRLRNGTSSAIGSSGPMVTGMPDLSSRSLNSAPSFPQTNSRFQ